MLPSRPFPSRQRGSLTKGDGGALRSVRDAKAKARRANAWGKPKACPLRAACVRGGGARSPEFPRRRGWMLVDPVLTARARFIKELPQRLGGDRAYQSDPRGTNHWHRKASRHRDDGSPARNGRKKPATQDGATQDGATQDGRKARPLKRRWKVERCTAWLNALRGLRVRATSGIVRTFRAWFLWPAHRCYYEISSSKPF